MPARRIQEFSGIMPRKARRLLPDGNAQVASNCLMTSGNVTPIYGPLLVQEFTGIGSIQSVYRMFSGTTDYWLRWAADVDVAKGPISGDESFRIYFSADVFEPRVTDFATATASSPYPAGWYVLGVTPPVAAISVDGVTGGAGDSESRAYVYTFVTQWGEESAPSPVSNILAGFANGTWNLSGMNTAPLNTYTVSALSWLAGVLSITVNTTFGLRASEYLTLSGFLPNALNNSFKVLTAGGTTVTLSMPSDPGLIVDSVGLATRDAPHNVSGMVKRIYRSVTTSTDTEYFFIDEIAVGITTYNDSVTVIGGPVATIGWLMPPAELRGLVTHPSGSLVGFVGNILCASQPLSPYAWPLALQTVTDYPIVGVDVFGQSILVGTAGTPYVVSGVAPDSFTSQKLDQPWPCISKRSVVSLGSGVAYASPLGLAVVGNMGTELITQDHYTFVEWATFNPGSFLATQHDNRYYAGYTLADGLTGGMWVFGQNINVTESSRPTCLYTDPGTGRLYGVIDNVLYQWMGDVGTRLSGDYMSKEFIEENPFNLGAAKVEADFTTSAASQAAALANYNAILAANVAMIVAKTSKGSLNALSIGKLDINGSLLGVLPPLTFESLSFTLYKDNQAIFSRQVTDSNVFRLPAGLKYDNYAVRVSGNVPVQAVVVGPTPLSLKGV